VSTPSESTGRDVGRAIPQDLQIDFLVCRVFSPGTDDGVRQWWDRCFRLNRNLGKRSSRRRNTNLPASAVDIHSNR